MCNVKVSWLRLTFILGITQTLSNYVQKFSQFVRSKLAHAHGSSESFTEVWGDVLWVLHASL